MTARPSSGLLVAAMIRRVNQAGGTAMVLARGDETAGGMLVVCAERGDIMKIIERGHDLHGKSTWRESGRQVVEKTMTLGDYLERRRSSDPDLWAVELDIADSERFAAEMTGDG